MITNITGTQPARFMLDGLYAWAENIPEGEAPQAYLDAQIDRLRLQTRKMEYQDAPGRDTMTLIEFDALIVADEAGEKAPFPTSHPVDETFADIAEDKANIQAAIAQIADANTRDAFDRILASRVRKPEKV